MAEPVELSATLEDYLEAMAQVAAERGVARVRDIAAALSVHKSTVSGALRSLSEKGLVDYAPYEIATLTPQGQEVARRIARRHFSRLLEFFDTDRHKQVRLSLQFNLKAIICQKLLPSIKPGVSRIPALEIMIVNAPIAKLIEKGEDVRILDVIKNSRSEGMIDFNRSLYDLIKEGYVDQKVALETATSPQALQGMLEGVFVTEGSLAGGIRASAEI